VARLGGEQASDVLRDNFKLALQSIFNGYILYFKDVNSLEWRN